MQIDVYIFALKVDDHGWKLARRDHEISLDNPGIVQIPLVNEVVLQASPMPSTGPSTL